jgi:fucose permease
MNPIGIFLGFFIYSVSVNIFGTLASEIMTTTALPLSQAGSLLGTLQLGAFVGIGLSPVVLKKCREGSILRLGMTVLGIALSSLVFFPSKGMLFVLFACLGLGGFYVDSGSNAFLSSCFPAKRATYIPILHFVYSLGALTSGYLILPFKGPTWHLGYAICGLVLLVLLVGGLLQDRRKGRGAIGCKESQAKGEKLPVKTILKDKVFLRYCAVLMLYMASQQTCTSWLPLYIETSFDATPSMVATTMMSFWVGIAVMRLISPILLHKGFHPLVLSSCGLALSFLALLGALISKQLAVAYVCIVLCGFGAGATIPLFIVEVTSWFPSNAAFLSVFYILCGTFGKMVFPYLVALVAEAYSLKLALLLSSLLLFLGFFLSVVVYRQKRAYPQEQS